MDKNDIIRQIEDGMGSEGSREQAEKFYDYCHENDLIEYDDNSIKLKKLSDEDFLKIWNKVLSYRGE